MDSSHQISLKLVENPLKLQLCESDDFNFFKLRVRDWWSTILDVNYDKDGVSFLVAHFPDANIQAHLHTREYKSLEQHRQAFRSPRLPFPR